MHGGVFFSFSVKFEASRRFEMFDPSLIHPKEIESDIRGYGLFIVVQFIHCRKGSDSSRLLNSVISFANF